jgi:hypothetical protein
VPGRRPHSRLVPSGRERPAGEDARLSKEQRASRSASRAGTLLVFVHPSSERTLDPARRDNSFPEKQECHVARLLVVPSWRVRPGPRMRSRSRERGREAACASSGVGCRRGRSGARFARGLGAPLLIVADGAPGLVKAIEQCWPASDRQRCCVHRARNLSAKLPERDRERVKHAYWQALDDAISAKDAKQRLQTLVDDLDRGGFASAAKCLADDLDALVVHLRYPPRHRRRWRSTNLLERSLGEVKRRTKVMGRFPGEHSCLTLVWAVLDLLITHETNGIRFTELDRQRLNRVRYHEPDHAIPEEATAA